MPAKKIVCPLCDEVVVLGKPTKAGSYFCPSCHGEITVQRSRRKVRERRSGVVVGGEVYGVKPPSDEPAKPVARKPASPPEPRSRSADELPLEHDEPQEFDPRPRRRRPADTGATAPPAGPVEEQPSAAPQPAPAARTRPRPQPLWTQPEEPLVPPRPEPGHEAPEDDGEFDDDTYDEAYDDEAYDDDSYEYEEDEVVVSAGGRTTRQLVSTHADEEDDDDQGHRDRRSRTPRQSRTSRNTARMAVALVLLVLVGVVTAGVVWLQGMFSEPDAATTNGGPRLQIPVTGGGEGTQRSNRGPDRRDVDVDRFLETTRRSVEADALGQAAGNGSRPAPVQDSLAGSETAAAPEGNGFGVDVEAASRVAEAFLQANTAEERGRLIRNRETDLPLMMDHYQRNPGHLNLGGELGPAVVDQERQGYIGFRVRLGDGTERMIGLERRTEGYRVDWPSFAIHHEREWQQFVNNRITNPTLVRVLAAPVDYYNFEFSDADVYFCLRLENGRDRLGDEPLYGYISRDHEQFPKLLELVEMAAGTDLPLVLRIKFPLLPSAPNQVEITELVSNGWMLRD